MSQLLSSLVSQLEEDVPASGGVPSEEQYERAIRDAVADFSRRCGTEKVATLSIISGTATYSLADDFLKMIMLESFATADGVLISAAGIIPLSTDWTETYYIRNKQITFSPTPNYTMARDYRYKAAWVATVDDYDEEYADLGDEEAAIILMKAQATCLTKQSNSLAPEAMDYQQGDVKVSTGTQTMALRAQADALEKQYLDACQQYNSHYGVLA